MSAESAFQSYIATHTRMRELSARSLIVGTLLGMVFGASSLYLVLKVGLTVSASIPVAVISITLFRLGSKLGLRDATVLENNIVQTAGSAGESIAFGVGVTMPAIVILGASLDIARVTLVCVLGGVLGILMMIPLRRALIVAQHGQLKYPEGTACAEVIKAGASRESRDMASEAARNEALAADAAGLGGSVSARTIFAGFAIGLAYKVAMSALKLWKDIPEKVFGAPLEAGSIAVETSPELLGVGYIIGPRIAATMCAGGVLAYLLLTSMIKFFGAAIPGPLPPGTIPISQMGPDEIRSAYVLYIGAGAVTAGGIIGLFRSLPTIWHGLREGLRDVGASRAAVVTARRTEQDLPMKLVGIGIVLLLAIMMLAPQLRLQGVVGFTGALLIVVFGFLFVTVSSRLTGEIGSTSNPISGMTVATLLLTCLIFLLLGWDGPDYYVTALSIGAIVCIAASNGGTTSQDLKTGYLLGATPRLQQIAIIAGALASALIMGPILLKLDAAATVYVPIAQAAPAGLTAPAGAFGGTERVAGVQADTDARAYQVWYKSDDAGGAAGKYLVDGDGKAVYLVDPGINGAYTERPDGSNVAKFDAPKATLMSYIIKGILSHELPWALVLFGVMIAIVLEMSAIPSLAFAVGVYLPISSSVPLFIGGMVRWLVDRQRRAQLAHAGLTEERLLAEGDRSAGVMMASGYIAGGAIAGIAIAFMAGVLGDFDREASAWAVAHNPLFHGPNADWLSLLPYAALAFLLYLSGRDRLFARLRGDREAPRQARDETPGRA